MEDVNRIKVVLVEKKKTSKWLSEQMGGNAFNCFQMVYQFIPTRFEQFTQNCRFVRSRFERTDCSRV